MEKRPQNTFEIIKGNATVQKKERKSTKHIYSINATEDIRVRENTLYFPGWKVFVDGVIVPVEFQDTLNRGLQTFFVPKGNHRVVVEFLDTKLRELANYISLITLLGIIFYIGRRIFIWRQSQ